MAIVQFTPNLAAHVDCPPTRGSGDTVGEVLASAFATLPRARAYVLDDQGRLRKHVTVFVNGRQIADRAGLGDPVGDADEVFVMQALSGG